MFTTDGTAVFVGASITRHRATAVDLDHPEWNRVTLCTYQLYTSYRIAPVLSCTAVLVVVALFCDTIIASWTEIYCNQEPAEKHGQSTSKTDV